MLRARTTTRLISAIALLAIVLRVLMPALHSHGHDHGAGDCSDAVAACSCGAVHGFGGDSGRDPTRDGEQVDAAPEAHFCLACAIEEGTPVDFPPSADLHAPQGDTAGPPARSTRDVTVASQVRLPATRAPPDDEA